ncbi:protein transport protein Sec61 subunit gamma-1-like protein [Cinnamomum micranthum f. kanehirae]|uniref:Protein transport protein Sec61 subunit gamma-1-like protein n=1 Tax=Cinnamomum micranthum f. kanehirae TaxID=337451 RepID=A0A443NNB9_9MAGN|nr:protein transport protein Sec61 subunit gamma-1-like protein [Cinnamomum micranthum f. kanehirae]
MDALDSVVDPLRGFAKDSARLVKRCHTNPIRKGFFVKNSSSSQSTTSSSDLVRLGVIWQSRLLSGNERSYLTIHDSAVKSDLLMLWRV